MRIADLEGPPIDCPGEGDLDVTFLRLAAGVRRDVDAECQEGLSVLGRGLRVLRALGGIGR